LSATINVTYMHAIWHGALWTLLTAPRWNILTYLLILTPAEHVRPGVFNFIMCICKVNFPPNCDVIFQGPVKDTSCILFSWDTMNSWIHWKSVACLFWHARFQRSASFEFFLLFYFVCVLTPNVLRVRFFLNSNRVQDHHTEHTHDNSVNCDLSKYRDLTGRPTELKRTRRLDQPTAKCDVLHLHHTNHDHQLTATMQTSFHINVSTTDVMH